MWWISTWWPKYCWDSPATYCHREHLSHSSSVSLNWSFRKRTRTPLLPFLSQPDNQSTFRFLRIRILESFSPPSSPTRTSYTTCCNCAGIPSWALRDTRQVYYGLKLRRHSRRLCSGTIQSSYPPTDPSCWRLQTTGNRCLFNLMYSFCVFRGTGSQNIILQAFLVAVQSWSLTN